MDATEKESTRKVLLENLIRGAVIVTFTKSNGEKRVMKCTLQRSKLPKREMTESKDRPNKEPNKDIIPVFDLEAKAWRSFRVDSVTEFKFSI